MRGRQFDCEGVEHLHGAGRSRGGGVLRSVCVKDAQPSPGRGLSGMCMFLPIVCVMVLFVMWRSSKMLDAHFTTLNCLYYYVYKCDLCIWLFLIHLSSWWWRRCWRMRSRRRWINTRCRPSAPSASCAATRYLVFCICICLLVRGLVYAYELKNDASWLNVLLVLVKMDQRFAYLHTIPLQYTSYCAKYCHYSCNILLGATGQIQCVQRCHRRSTEVCELYSLYDILFLILYIAMLFIDLKSRYNIYYADC